MQTSVASEATLVVLRPGVSVTQAAIQLLWELEDRDLTVRRDGPELLVGPRNQLTRADLAAIKAHRGELLSLLRVCSDVVM